MAWDFATDPAFEEQLAWSQQLVRDEVIPLETLDLDHATLLQLVRPMQDKVRERGLWAAHLGPELGGQGMGQVKLALLQEVLGQCAYAPLVFGNNAPDSGNAE